MRHPVSNDAEQTIKNALSHLRRAIRKHNISRTGAIRRRPDFVALHMDAFYGGLEECHRLLAEYAEGEDHEKAFFVGD
jgi:hypothetical protein